MRTIDVSGQVFGYLTADVLIKSGGDSTVKGRSYLCTCICGNTVIVEQRLLLRDTRLGRNCGCMSDLVYLPRLQGETLMELLERRRSFCDVEKYNYILKRLLAISKWGRDSEELYSYVEFFYSNCQFNLLYQKWLDHCHSGGKYSKLYAPSVDHIVPKSRGGGDDLANLQFLSYFENCCKRDMTMIEWESFKARTHTVSDLFLKL